MSDHMTGSLARLKTGTEMCHIEISLTDSVSAALLLVLVPVIDLALVPFLRYITINPSILKRLSFGATLASLGMLALFLIEAMGSYVGNTGDATCVFNADKQPPAQLAVNVYWLVLPIVIMTVAEIFIYIPSTYGIIIVVYVQNYSLRV